MVFFTMDTMAFVGKMRLLRIPFKGHKGDAPAARISRRRCRSTCFKAAEGSHCAPQRENEEQAIVSIVKKTIVPIVVKKS